MTEQIYIDGQLMDTDAESKGVQLVYQSPYLTDIESIVSNRTNSVSLPLTQNNIKVLGLYSSQVQAMFPYRKHKVTYKRDGVQLFSGSATLLNVTDKAITMCFVWGNNEVFQSLFDTSLRELTSLSVPEIYIRSNNTTYIADKIECGTGIKMPAIKVRDIMTRIGQVTGITIPDILPDDEELAVLLSTLNGDWNTKYMQGITILNTGLNPFTQPSQFIATMTKGGGSVDAKGLMNNVGTINTEGATQIQVTIRGTFELLVRTTTMADIPLWLECNGKLLAQSEQGVRVGTATRYVFRELDVDATIDLNGVANTAIVIAWSASPAVVTDVVLDVDLIEEFHVMLDPADIEQVMYPTPYVVGANYPIIANLPDMSCGQFIKEFMQMYGKFAYTDQYGNMQFTTISDLYAGMATAKDWTDKVLKLKPQTTEYKLPNFAQRNWFRYAEDEALPTDNIINGFLDVDNTTLERERDAVKLSFVPAYGNYVPVWEMDDDEVKYIGDSRKPRLIGGVNVINISDMQYYYNLTWHHLLGTYYAEYARMILHPVIIKASAVMTTADLQALDLTKPVYLRQTGHYYCIRQLTTKGDNTADVELIQL